MQYLAYLGGKARIDGRSVEQQVLESNLVLEAFGNAKTVRNNNSSRFGKFVEIQFDKNGKISGAAVKTYLLERSHVCQISDPERNYHCFYMLCTGPPEVKHLDGSSHLYVHARGIEINKSLKFLICFNYSPMSFSEARRRKWPEDNPEATSNDELVVFDTSIIPWWAWIKKYHLPEGEKLNGCAASFSWLTLSTA